MWTRRTFNRTMMAAAVGSLLPAFRAVASPTRSLFIERLLERFPAPASQREFSYRADVTIQIFRIPVYRKRGVGGAVANLREYRAGAESAIGISFLAGSNPENAGGVNRFGYIEEVVVEQGSVPSEAAYFGVMTSSPEDDFESARSALGEAGNDQAFYAAIDGYLKASKSVSTEAAFLSSGRYTWFGHPPLAEFMKSALASDSSRVKEKSQANSRWEIPITFLYAIAKAMRQPSSKQKTNYIYHGQEFELETQIAVDRRRGEEFQSSGIVADATKVLRLEGKSRHLGSGQQASFTIWKDDSDPTALPLRFEFQPRSFLKLTFEQDRNVKRPRTAEHSVPGAVSQTTGNGGQAVSETPGY